jgi:quinol-cytochrome oxidoreductase complex cytochrome b subunit
MIKKLVQRTTKAISKFTVEYPFTTYAILWFFVVLLSGIIYRLTLQPQLLPGR